MEVAVNMYDYLEWIVPAWAASLYGDNPDVRG